MADGAYERRGPREAELRRLGRIIEEARRRRGASAPERDAAPEPAERAAEDLRPSGTHDSPSF